jgi:hypothetical protein
MKLTYKQVLTTQLVQFIARLQNTKMPIRTAYWLLKLAKKIDTEVSEAMLLFQKLGDNYGIKDGEVYKMRPDGKHVVPEEKAEEYNQELEKFLNIEFETGIEKLKASDLEAAQVSPAEITLLEMIAEPLA